MLDRETVEFLNSIHADISSCGSRITCNPPPVDTDADFLVLILPHDVAGAMLKLESLNYIWEGASEHYQNTMEDGFSSFRKGEINLLVSANPEFARRHKAATYICKRLNLQNKDDRIALFQAVLYGEQWADK